MECSVTSHTLFECLTHVSNLIQSEQNRWFSLSNLYLPFQYISLSPFQLFRSKLTCHLRFLLILTSNASLRLVGSTSQMFHEPITFITSTATLLIPTTICRGQGNQGFSFWHLSFERSIRPPKDNEACSDINDSSSRERSGLQIHIWKTNGCLFKAVRLHEIT